MLCHRNENLLFCLFSYLCESFVQIFVPLSWNKTEVKKYVSRLSHSRDVGNNITNWKKMKK